MQCIFSLMAVSPSISLVNIRKDWASEMAQWIKEIATKTDRKERTHSCKVPFDLHMCVHMHASTHKTSQ